MKKRILSVLLTLVMLISLVTVMSISASAETVTEYGLSIGGVPVTSDNCVIDSTDSTDITNGSATYDPDTKTLTLDNFSCSSDAFAGVINIQDEDGDITIKLKGNNTLTSTDEYTDGIYTNGNLAICNGEDGVAQGQLTINTVSSCINAPMGTLEITNVKVTATSTENNGLYAESISLSGVTLSATAYYGPIETCSEYLGGPVFDPETGGPVFDPETGEPVKVYGAINIENSTVEAYCTSGWNYYAFMPAPTITGTFDVYAGDNEAGASKEDSPTDATYTTSKYVRIEPVKYDFYIGGVQVTSANKDNIVVPGATGSATYDPAANTLTLDNFSYTGKGYNFAGNVYALIYSQDIDLKIVLKGTNTLAGADMYQEGIIIENGSLMFANSDEENVTGSLKLTAGYPVISLDNGSLSVENVNLTVINTLSPTGNPGDAIFVNGNILITNSDVTAISGDSDGDDIPEEGATFGITTTGSISVANSTVSAIGYAAGIWAGSLSVANSTVTAAGKLLAMAYINTEEGLVPNITGDYVVYAGDDAASATKADAPTDDTYASKYVKIEPVKYDLYIGGVQFTSGNLIIDSTDSTAISGSATYNPELNTLTLNNFQYSGPGYKNEEYEYLYGALRVEGDNDLRIVFTGQNVIECTNGDERWGLYTDFIGDLHIKAETIDSCLTFIGGDVACGRVPVFDGNFVIYAGDNEADAKITAEDTFASQYYTYSYVRYEPTLMVTFDYGTLGSETKTVFKDETVTPPAPAFAGKVLVGWYTDSNFTTEFNFSDAITANKTIYAKFADYEDDKGALQGAIDALEEDVEELNKLIETNGTIDQINDKITEIQNKINSLGETYATDAEVADAIAKAKEDVKIAYTTAIEDAVKKLEEKIAAQIDPDELANEIANVTALINALDDTYATDTAVAEAIEKAKSDITAAYTTAIEYAVKKLEEKIEAQIDPDELADEIAKVNTLINALDDTYATDTAVAEAIEKAKTDIATAYTKAIEDAVKKLEEKIAAQIDPDELAAEIKKVTDLIEKLDEIYATDAEVADAIAKAKSDLEELIDGVQSDLDTTKAKLDKAIEDLNKAITDGDKELADEIAALNTAIANAKTALEKADADDKADLEGKIANAQSAAILAAETLVNNAKTELQKKIDEKADTATVNSAIAELQNAIKALEDVKDNYASADAALKSELEAAIEKAKQEAIEASKGYIPHIGTNGNWWIGETDTGVDANGIKGDTGEQGPQGEKGDKGDTGATGNGIASITTSKANGITTVTVKFTDPTMADVVFTIEDGADGAKGEKGDKGDKGDTGAQGEKGDKGNTGAAGADGVGIANIEKTSSDSNVDTYTITLTNGTTYTFTVTNGTNGTDGKDGVDGKDGTNGTNGVDGKDGANGTDGQTPYIGENGNWWIGDTDTDVKAAGDDGKDGAIIVATAVGGTALISNIALIAWTLIKKKRLF